MHKVMTARRKVAASEVRKDIKLRTCAPSLENMSFVVFYHVNKHNQSPQKMARKFHAKHMLLADCKPHLVRFQGNKTFFYAQLI